jgi:hypothetical protein
MPRNEQEEYEQDRLGNVYRKLDRVRAEDGYSEDNGIITINTTAGAVDTEATATEIVYDLPDDVQQAHLVEIVINNKSADDSGSDLSVDYTIQDSTLDSNGNIDTTTKRSVTDTVGTGSRDEVEYTGREFSDGAIVIDAESEQPSAGNTATLEIEVGVSVYADHLEEYEGTTEITTSP